jgi:hypothetical protein
MRLNIVGDKRGLERATWECIQAHFEFALSSYEDHVGLVTVYLTDEGGSAGRVDKLCRIVVDLPGLGAVVVEVSDCDAAVLIDRAAERVEQAVRRRIYGIHPFAEQHRIGSVPEWN